MKLCDLANTGYKKYRINHNHAPIWPLLWLPRPEALSAKPRNTCSTNPWRNGQPSGLPTSMFECDLQIRRHCFYPQLFFSPSHPDLCPSLTNHPQAVSKARPCLRAHLPLLRRELLGQNLLQLFEGSKKRRGWQCSAETSKHTDEH